MASIAAYATEHGKRWRVNWREGDRRRSQGGLRSAVSAARLKGTVEDRLERSRGDGVPLSVPKLEPGFAADLRGYQTWLRSRGDTEKHVRATAALVLRVFSKCRWERLSEAKAEGFSMMLAAMRDSPDGVGYRTINTLITATKGFLRWAYRTARIDTEPLKGCDLLREQEDQRHPRRVASDSEIAALLASAPADRAILYRTAMGTGLRQNELRSLCVGSFRLDDGPPTVEVQAAYSKRRRTDWQPLPPDLVVALRPFLAGRDSSEQAFVVGKRPVREFKADLARAGIAYVIGRYPFLSGEGYFDFHSLRHVYGTRLAEAGVDPASVQGLMRHSTPTLTERYMHVTLHHLAGQAAKLKEAGNVAMASKIVG